ncbi:MAG: hypothetical protein PF508_19620 [Spirochaeta sp.]|nr:hypothetical protein [Spirochaeta sp.]
MAEVCNDSLSSHLKDSGRISLHTILWLTKIMVPASALVFVLRRTGLLERIAGALSGVMRFLELPGEAAVAVVTSVVTNLYGVIAMLPVLDLTLRQTTILALVTLVAHSFFVELAITRTTGTPVLRMLLVRGGGGIVLGRIMASVLPRDGRWAAPLRVSGGRPGGTAASASGAEVAGATGAAGAAGFDWAALGEATLAWLGETALLIGRIAVIVTVLLFFTRWLRYIGVTDALARRLRPLMSVFGLPHASSPAWVVANTLGLTYGAAVLREEVDSGRLKRSESDLLNHHLGISHSLLEDTLLFAAIGIPGLWIVIPRVLFAMAVVWERRLEAVLRGAFKRPGAVPAPPE